MADITHNSYARTGLLHRITEMVSGLKQSVSQYRTYRKTLGQLESLSAHELDDLGLTRSEIRRVAYHAAYH